MLALTVGDSTRLFDLLAEAPASWLNESEERAGRAEADGSLTTQDEVLNELTQKLTLAVTTTLVVPTETEASAGDSPAIKCNCELQDIRHLPIPRESGQVLPASTEHILSPPQLPRSPAAERVTSVPLRCADDVGRPIRYIVGACSVAAVVPRSLAKSRLETLREASAASSEQQQPQTQAQRVWEDFQLSWYTQAAMVFQPEAVAAPAPARDPHAHTRTAAGAGEKSRDRQECGGAATGHCSDGSNDETSSAEGRVEAEGARAAASTPGAAASTARLCYVQGGLPSQLSEPAERGIKRASWEEYGMKVLEVSCGKDGKGALMYGFTNDLYTAGDVPPWSLSHVVLSVFLDARPLQVIQSQLALAGDYRPLPRRVVQLAPAIETQMVLAAVGGALADAKAQLHAALAAHRPGGAFHTGNLLMGRLETRLNVSVPVVADALASIILRGYNPNLAPYACRLLDCQAAGLADSLYNKLYDNITRYMAEAEAVREAAKARRKRGRGRDGGDESDVTAGRVREEGGGDYGGAEGGSDRSYEFRAECGDLLVLRDGESGGERADYDVEDEVNGMGYDDRHAWDDEDGLVAVGGSYGGEEDGGGNERPPVATVVQGFAAAAGSGVAATADAAFLAVQEQSPGSEERMEARESATAEQDVACALTEAQVRDVACRSNSPQMQMQRQQQSHAGPMHRHRHTVAAVGALLGIRPLHTVAMEGGKDGDGEDDWAF